jgi:hypothetical protein
MSKRGFVVQLGLLVAISAGMVFASVGSDREMSRVWPESTIDGSIANIKRSGSHGFYAFLKKTFGQRVGQWRASYRLLTHGKNNYFKMPADSTLILVAPAERPDTTASDYLLDWIKKGNNLVYIDSLAMSYGKSLISKIGLTCKKLPVALVDADLAPYLAAMSGSDAGLFDHVDHVRVSQDGFLKGGTTLFANGDKALIVHKQIGKGHVLVIANPSFVSNRSIGLSAYRGNFQFLANWLADHKGKILVDQYCHGVSESDNVFTYVLRGPLGLAALQSILLLIVAILSFHQRFGRVIQYSPSRKISSLEHVDGLASVFERGRARTAILEIYFQQARLVLCRKIGISPHVDDETLLNELQKHGADPAFVLIDKKTRAVMAALSGTIGSDEQLRELSADCDEIIQTLQTVYTATNTPNPLAKAR